MSLFVCSLNSGSNGNCYYVGNDSDAVLIDAGLSCRETEKRMALAGLETGRLKAVFITHEHTDHIIGLETLVKKYRLPVFITPKTTSAGRLKLPAELIRDFDDGVPVEVGGLNVLPFAKQHDGADPYSFVVEGNGVKVGVMTDIGVACPQVIHYFKQCHAVFLESNYDDEMLKTGGYPLRLQKRITGGKGHLSNREALSLFEAHRSPFLTHVFLSHLSQNNNRPDLALEQFREYSDILHISVASRYQASPVYHILDSGLVDGSLKSVAGYKPVQFSLF